jgi:hypothetical protein
VYHLDRKLDVDTEDGFVGQLFSGYVVLEALCAPKRPTAGILRFGDDTYHPMQDWFEYKGPRPGTRAYMPWHDEIKERAARCRQAAPTGSSLYGLKMQIEPASHDSYPRVSYPNNMLMIAQADQVAGVESGLVKVWKVAVVAQPDESAIGAASNFFLTAQLVYEVQCCIDSGGKRFFPRLTAHRNLEDLVLELVDDHIELPTINEVPASHNGVDTSKLGAHDGIVAGFYQARNMGVLYTRAGKARVHATEVPARGRRRYLVPGERVRFQKLSSPQLTNPKHCDLEPLGRKRVSGFKWQAYGVELMPA